MAKRNTIKRNSVLVIKPKAADLAQPLHNPVVEDGVPLQLQKDLILNITGPVSGLQYLFEGSGSIVYVADEDVEKMLMKKSGAGCCGTPPSPYFKRVL